ncbi:MULTISPECIES: DUF58 domain-containing protein [Arthrobacter]|uniref:DUF58 domain-containing protein n=2 Tax=Arthrobacter TaxID=1663 RepID=A0ABU9KKB7_9MICC|nr:DUF58 domain-containing protein [Arthrobacter sp. YJM1]MDP5227349.1 DUF58 domain-containing protein [Arthrobacter sp. YJM1]
MALTALKPSRILTRRGMGFLLTGLACLAGAAFMGRRDLLSLSIFLMALPMLAAAALSRRQGRFRVRREFTPASEGATTVRLTVESLPRVVGGPGPARQSGALESTMLEQLPKELGGSPRFQYPSRGSRGGPVSAYEYVLVPPHRGLFRVGGVLAEFRDPFSLAHRRHRVDPGTELAVAPALVDASPGLVELVRGHSGAGVGGSQSTSWVASASENDVMVREYRHGDALRRVHWPSTARRGELMVRHEEGGALPRVTLVLDRRAAAHSGGDLAGLPVPAAAEALRTSITFEWQIKTCLSLAVGLSAWGHELQLLDHALSPAFLGSRGTARPEAGLLRAADVHESLPGLLAAVELDDRPHPLDAGGSGNLVVVFTGRLSLADAEDLAAGVLSGPGVESSWSGAAGPVQATVISCWPGPPAAPVKELLESSGWRVLWARPDSDPGQAEGPREHTP